MTDYEARELLKQLQEMEKNADTAEKARDVAEIYENVYSTLVEDCESNEEILQCEQSMLNAIKWFKKAYEYKDTIAAIDIADSYFTLAQTGSIEYADEAIQWCEIAKKHSDLSNHISEIESILADSQRLKQEMIEFLDKSRSKNKKSIWWLIVGIVFGITCFSTASLWSGVVAAICLYVFFKK